MEFLGWVRLPRSTWSLSLGDQGGKATSRRLAATGVLELRGELTAATDLDGPQGEGQSLLKRPEELCSQAGASQVNSLTLGTPLVFTKAP